MKLHFTADGWASYTSWLEDDRRMLKRINRLIAEIMRDDDEPGIGKPELLRGDLAGLMSRRINEEHRLVYEVKNDVLSIVSCRFHY